MDAPLTITAFSETQKIAFLLEYNGRGFHGTQRQKSQTGELQTLQLVLAQALATLRVPVMGSVNLCSRLDAGVHARGLVGHFSAPLSGLANISDLKRALNAVLPDSVYVKQVALSVRPDFHSQLHARGKWYRYSIQPSMDRFPLASPDTVPLRKPLDLSVMREVSRQFLGTHTFTSFKCPDTDVVDDICTLQALNIREEEGGRVILDIVANRFLYKMVRNIVGLLLQVGQPPHRVSASLVEDLLSRPRASANRWTAPASGLCLMAVDYPAEHQYFATDANVQLLSRFISMESIGDENLFCKAS
jgi:tRNA pseudouridine38-40 synthase